MPFMSVIMPEINPSPKIRLFSGLLLIKFYRDTNFPWVLMHCPPVFTNYAFPKAGLLVN